MKPAPPLPGILLAAGNSQRMGKNKLLLPFRGKPILQHAIDAAHFSSLSPLIVVLSVESTAIRKAVDTRSALVVENPAPYGGYGSSLQTGLRAIDPLCSGAMFLPGDQPLLHTETIEQLIAAFHQEPERWIAPSWKGQRGNPVITPVAWFDRVFALDGDTGPRKHLRDPSANLKLIETEDQGVIFDIDTPEDYTRLLALE